MTDLSYLDTNTSNIEVPKEPPEGDYLGELVDFEREDRDDGKVNYTLQFKVEEPLDSTLDLTGVKLNRPFYSNRIVVSDKNMGYVLRDMNRFGVDLNGVPFAEIFQKLVDAQPKVKLRLKYDKWMKEKRDQLVARVDGWSAVA